MQLDAGQKRRLKRSERRAAAAGKTYEWPTSQKIRQEREFAATASKTSDLEKSTNAKDFQTHLRQIARVLETLTYKYLPDERSVWQERADEFRMRSVWRKFRTGCKIAKRDLSVMCDVFNHWRFRPEGAGMYRSMTDFRHVSAGNKIEME